MTCWIKLQWIPRDSEIWRNYDAMVGYFGNFVADLTLIIEDTNGDNLLTPEKMDVLYDIFLQSVNVSFEYNGETWTFDDLCEKRYFHPNESCRVYTFPNGFFSLWNFDPTTWQTQELIQTRINLLGSLTGVRIKISELCFFCFLFIVVLFLWSGLYFQFVLFLVSLLLLFCVLSMTIKFETFCM